MNSTINSTLFNTTTILTTQLQGYLENPLFLPFVFVFWSFMMTNHKYRQTLNTLESFKNQSADEIFSLQKSLSRLIGSGIPPSVKWSFDSKKAGVNTHAYPANINKILEEAWQRHIDTQDSYGVQLDFNGFNYNVDFVCMEQRNNNTGNIRAVHRKVLT
jgi:hypothetical protein